MSTRTPIIACLAALLCLSACSAGKSTSQSTTSNTADAASVSDSQSGDVANGADAGDATTSQQAMMQLVQASDGHEYLCQSHRAGTTYGYNCVRKGTSDAYICKIHKGMPAHCVPASSGKPQWTPPCKNYMRMGDMGPGPQCWDPPSAHCPMPMVGGQRSNPPPLWICDPSGWGCCFRVGATQWCSDCGWVSIYAGSPDKCSVNMANKSTSFCQNYLSNLPQIYKKCLETGQCDAAKQAAATSTVCTKDWTVPDAQLLICP